MRVLLICIFLVVYLDAWKLEADKVTVNTTTGDITTHVTFNNAFDSVPVVFTLTDDRGAHPASLRVANVTTTGFDIYTIEPQGEDGPHLNMYNIPYIAVTKGEHTLPDGTKLVADIIDTQAFQSKTLSEKSWDSVSLSGFNTRPTILAEIQTRNNERTDVNVPDSVSMPFFTAIVDSVSSSGFNIALERSETTDGTISSTESIGYLAIDSGINGGNHYFASLNGDKIEYESIRTGNIIKGWDEGNTAVSFSKTYDEPVVVATKNTRIESDGGWLRTGSITTSGVTLKVDEDRAVDSERSHVGEIASILLFSEPFSAEFLDSNAELVINEIMYKETVLGSDNDEFVVKKSGNIKGYAISDQDCNIYIFPTSCQVNVGDYVVFHSGTGVDSCSGNVKHFFRNSSQYFNNTTDDVLLLKPNSFDVTGTTNTSSCGKRYFNATPVDYVAYGTGGVVDAIPTSMKGVTLSWDDSYSNEIDNAGSGVSIALSPNAVDGDKSACWEFSASGNASDNGCSGYLLTQDTNNNSGQTNSIENINTSSPKMSIIKSSVVISDPVNGNNMPKRIPGAIIRYCFVVDNTGDGDASSVKIDDSLIGNGKENLTYNNSGFIVQNINSSCNCKAITDTSGTITNSDVTIEIGTLKGTSDPSKQRACAYIDTEMN